MDNLSLNVTPYTINAVSLIIIGFTSIIYIARIKQKTTPIKWMIFGLASFTTGMFMMMANAFVLWGAAFSPLTDTFSVISMFAMVEFALNYPEPVRTKKSWVVRFVMFLACLVSLFIGIRNTVLILVFHQYVLHIQPFFWVLNPATFLIALMVCIERTIFIQANRKNGIRNLAEAFFKPQDREARLMRNFSLAMSIGLVQGIVSGFNWSYVLSGKIGMYLIAFSLLFLVAALVYTSFDITNRQPGVVVRLVGLSLITLLAVLSIISIFNEDILLQMTLDRYAATIENTKKIIKNGWLAVVPNEVDFIRMVDDGGNSNGELIYHKDPDFNIQWITHDNNEEASSPIWAYYFEYPIKEMVLNKHWESRMYYGTHPIGSYNQFFGIIINLDGKAYEIGFDMQALNDATQKEPLCMVVVVISSALFILFIFPLIFRFNLIHPLDRLLAGVRQVKEGNLDVHVKVTRNDEVGFLTDVFNKMITSLKEELDAREKAETKLRLLNQTLEDSINERTYELEALYNITTASIQVMDSQALFNDLLARCMHVFRTEIGFLLLFDQKEENASLELAACQGLPLQWCTYLKNISPENNWIRLMMDQAEPVLLDDISQDDRLPQVFRSVGSLNLVLSLLKVEGKTLGMIGMARPAVEKFNLDEISLLISIVNQIGIAVHTDQLRQIVQRSTMIEERQRLARDLHDSVTQSLYGLTTLTEVGLMKSENGEFGAISEIFKRIGQTTRQAIREMRLFIHQLRLPELEQEGLINALDLRLAAVEGRSDIKAQLIADDNINLPLPVETALFHIAQEALNNSLKHASASNVTVFFTHIRDGIKMDITDDGVGFDKDKLIPGGMGLDNMKDRAKEIGASLNITTKPGGGTKVTVLIEDNK